MLLLDRKGRMVIVECKQNSPSEADVNQIRHYMTMARKEILGPKSKTPIRGVLVHGGSKKSQMLSCNSRWLNLTSNLSASLSA